MYINEISVSTYRLNFYKFMTARSHHVIRKAIKYQVMLHSRTNFLLSRYVIEIRNEYTSKLLHRDSTDIDMDLTNVSFNQVDRLMRAFTPKQASMV